jgi:hypothetical protein
LSSGTTLSRKLGSIVDRSAFLSSVAVFGKD